MSTSTLNESGAHIGTVMRLASRSADNWDLHSFPTRRSSDLAPTLDGALLNSPGTMAVNFPVVDGGSFTLLNSDYHDSAFLPVRTLTLTATFADGSTASATATVAAAVACNAVSPNRGEPAARV